MCDAEINSAHELYRKIKVSAADPSLQRRDIDWIVIFLSAILLTAFGFSILFALQGLYPVIALAAVNTCIIYASQIVVHEASHGNIVNEKRFGSLPNDLLGYLTCLPLLWDFKTFQASHLAHHKHTNDRDADPQFPGRTLENWQNLYEMFSKFGSRNGSDTSARKMQAGGSKAARLPSDIFQPPSWYVFNGGIIIFFLITPKVLILVWLIPAIIASCLLSFMHNALHTDAAGDAPAIRKTKLIVAKGLLGKILNVGFLYQNYHLIHHMMPKLPFHKTVRVSRAVLEDQPIRGITNLDFTAATMQQEMDSK